MLSRRSTDTLFLQQVIKLSKQYPGLDHGVLKTLISASEDDLKAIKEFTVKSEHYKKEDYLDCYPSDFPSFCCNGNVIEVSVNNDDIIAIPILTDTLYSKAIHIVCQSRYEELRRALNKSHSFMEARLEEASKYTLNCFIYISKNDPDQVEKLLKTRKELHMKKFHSKVVLDIQLFYSSIYSHIIAWLSVGIDEANLIRSNDIWFNLVDEAVRNCIRKETSGIPIGPQLFDVVAEYILRCIDEKIVLAITEELKRKESDFKCIRRCDNYEFYILSTLLQPSDLCILIASVFADYRLNINPLKEVQISAFSFEMDPLYLIKHCSSIDDCVEILAKSKNSIDLDLIKVLAADYYCNCALEIRSRYVRTFLFPEMIQFTIKAYLEKGLSDMDIEIVTTSLSNLNAPWRVKWSLQMLWIVKLCADRGIGFANSKAKAKDDPKIVVDAELHKSIIMLKKNSKEEFGGIAQLIKVVK